MHNYEYDDLKYPLDIWYPEYSRMPLRIIIIISYIYLGQSRAWSIHPVSLKTKVPRYNQKLHNLISEKGYYTPTVEHTGAKKLFLNSNNNFDGLYSYDSYATSVHSSWIV